MATKVWEVTKVYECEFSKSEVAFETQLVYPADHLPDPPRVVAHRCSNAQECDLGYHPYCPYGIHNNHIHYSH